jgi:hypothetical protein
MLTNSLAIMFVIVMLEIFSSFGNTNRTGFEGNISIILKTQNV